MKLWEDVRGTGDYGVWQLLDNNQALSVLKEMFPSAKADEMNFVLFSTSGVHGSYQTLEQEEQSPGTGVTFMVIQPRLVLTRYGMVYPKTEEDFVFLKKLRSSSWQAMTNIGS